MLLVSTPNAPLSGTVCPSCCIMLAVWILISFHGLSHTCSWCFCSHVWLPDSSALSCVAIGAFDTPDHEAPPPRHAWPPGHLRVPSCLIPDPIPPAPDRFMTRAALKVDRGIHNRSFDIATSFLWTNKSPWRLAVFFYGFLMKLYCSPTGRSHGARGSRLIDTVVTAN